MRAFLSWWRLGLLWLMIAIALTVTGASAVAIIELQRDAAQRSELRVLLTDMKVAAWQQNALRSQAILANGLSPSAALTRQLVDDTVDAIGGRFEDRDPESTHAQAVQAAF